MYRIICLTHLKAVIIGLFLVIFNVFVLAVSCFKLTWPILVFLWWEKHFSLELTLKLNYNLTSLTLFFFNIIQKPFIFITSYGTLHIFFHSCFVWLLFFCNHHVLYKHAALLLFSLWEEEDKEILHIFFTNHCQYY